MVYECDDTSKVRELFAGWQETLIYSCLQQVMGKIYVTDLDHPKSAFAFVGCFGFFAGKPDRELVVHKPEGFVILTPQNEAWAKLIEECYPDAKRVIRYAIRKDTRFDTEALQRNVEELPEGYELRAIDSALYDQCLENPVTEDFVSVFVPYESENKAREANKEYFDNLNSLIEDKVYYYYCPKVKNNECSDYKNRPDICKDFPHNPLKILPPSCYFNNWKEEVSHDARRLKAKVDIIDFYKHKLG